MMNFLTILEQFDKWITDGNAYEIRFGVYVEQTTQYTKEFTQVELLEFFKKEYID